MTYTQFYSKHYSEVYRFVCKKITDQDEAKDFTQNVFMKIYSNWKNIDVNKASHKTYMYNAVKNGLTDHYKKKKLGVRVEISDGQSDDDQEIRQDKIQLASNWNPELQSIRNEYISNFKKELLSLPTNQRRVANLYFIHGYTINEVSGITHISMGTISPMLQKLRKFFSAI